MGGRLRVTATALVIAVALVAPVLAASIASPASADVVVNGCTVVSNPTPTHFTNCPNMAIGSLAGLNLSYANFAGSSFAGCDSSSCGASDLTGANLTRANLSGAQVFDSVVVVHPPFPPSIVAAGANFTGAILSGANLTNVNFGVANLTNANLTGANLAGASFEASNSEFGITVDATLTGANFTGTIVVPSNQSVGATSQAGAVVTWPTPPSLPGRRHQLQRGLGIDLPALRHDRDMPSGRGCHRGLPSVGGIDHQVVHKDRHTFQRSDPCGSPDVRCGGR